MKTKILIVDDTFSIHGRGLVICARKTDEFVDFKIGDSFEIQTSEKTFLQTNVMGLETLYRRPYNDKILCFMVGKKSIKPTCRMALPFGY